MSAWLCCIDASMARNAAARGAGIRILVLLSVVLSTACTREPATTVSFNDTVQPILSENCYLCHGPDASTRKAGLRLDKAEFAYAPHEQFGPAIIPGKPDRSPLVKRIEASDPRERMPPPEAHKTLEPEEIALLRQWVQEGAEYRKHWAFIAPTRPTIPETAANAPHAEGRVHVLRRSLRRDLVVQALVEPPHAGARGLDHARQALDEGAQRGPQRGE
jgi:mono/diheme cytochrome c family protein